MRYCTQELSLLFELESKCSHDVDRTATDLFHCAQESLAKYRAKVREMAAKLGRQRGAHSSVGILRSDQPRGSKAYKKQVKRQAQELKPVVDQFVADNNIQLLADALAKLFDMVPALREVCCPPQACLEVTASCISCILSYTTRWCSDLQHHDKTAIAWIATDATDHNVLQLWSGSCFAYAAFLLDMPWL